MTEFICATPLFQANSSLQGERHRAAVVSAGDSLNDGSTYTSPFAVGPDILATGLAVEPWQDQLLMRCMKKRKLKLKDWISHLESLLIPDLDA